MNDKSPCFGCEERHVGCHAECCRYLEWRKQKDEQNEAVRAEKISNNLFSHGAWLMKKARQKKK